MEDPKITPEQLVAAWTENLHALAEKVAATLNQARPGRIIADSEEGVRDANAEFREQTYQKSIDLLAERQEAFSPSADRPVEAVGQQGQAEADVSDSQRSPDVSPDDLLAS